MNDLRRALLAGQPELGSVFSGALEVGWLVQGPQLLAFEAELARYIGVDYALGVGNGTDALELSLRALMPVGKTKVMTAANCGGYTTVASLRAGFAVCFADVDPQTCLLDVKSVSDRMSDDVGVVVVTHLYGRAADIGQFTSFCAPRGVRVLEDCAEAIGAEISGQRVGGLGDAGAFSFYPTKNLGALGDGGAIATRNPEIAERVQLLRQYGWQHKYEMAIDGGRNSRLDEIQAAFLLSRLPKLEAWNERRRQIITRYASAASGRITVLPANGRNHVGHLAVLLCEDREALRAHLESHHVRTDVHFPIPDYRQPALLQLFTGIQLPATEYVTERILSIPVFPELHDYEIERVCDALATF